MNIPTPLSLLNLDPETNARVHSILASGTAPNTRRAYASDLRYFWAWARLALGLPAVYPAPLAAVIRFVTDHLEGLPETVDATLMAEGAKARPGVHSIATVARRLAALSVAHENHGQENPVQTPTIRALMAAARRGRARLGLAPQKKRAATLDVLEAMLATCDDDLHGIRDRALLLFAFASGGRRRSEVASAQVENLTSIPEGFVYRIPWSKTDQRGAGREVPILGTAALGLQSWLNASRISNGYLFRAVVRRSGVGGGLSEKAVTRIVQKRAGLAGLDAKEFGAHSLRSGYITEAGRKGVPSQDAMALTGHKSAVVFNGYYRPGSIVEAQASWLAD